MGRDKTTTLTFEMEEVIRAHITFDRTNAKPILQATVLELGNWNEEQIDSVVNLANSDERTTNPT